MPERLFDEATLRKLDRLSLVANRVRTGTTKGERRSKKRGTSIEFADYRNYTRGDDLRRVDWNVYARLDRPFIKLFEEEEDLAVHILIDASASMDWPQAGDSGGNIEHHKFRFAQRIAAGLAYIALGSGDYTSVTALYGPGQNVTWGPYRGRGRSLRLLDFIGELQPIGELDLNAAMKDYVMRYPRPGLALLISDLLTPRGFEDGFSALQSVGNEVGVIHILSPDEVDPQLAGDLQLIDIESGLPQDLTVDSAMRELYTKRLLAWRNDIMAHCLKRGIHYATMDTAVSWEEVILFELRRLGVVR